MERLFCEYCQHCFSTNYYYRHIKDDHPNRPAPDNYKIQDLTLEYATILKRLEDDSRFFYKFIGDRYYRAFILGDRRAETGLYTIGKDSEKVKQYINDKLNVKN
ncbi:MAG: hypothetical protein GY718_12670 [Lentisphaerae bacterium]|nr:hypothetical protein [Lentisphaerota bacterium]